MHNGRFNIFIDKNPYHIVEPISSLISVLSWYTRYHIKAYIPLFNVALPHRASFLCAKSHMYIHVSLRCQQSQFLVIKADMNIYRQIYVFICHIWKIREI